MRVGRSTVNSYQLVRTALVPAVAGNTIPDVEAYCLRHRRRVIWSPAPAWWHHVTRRPSDDADGRCPAMLNTYAPRRL